MRSAGKLGASVALILALGWGCGAGSEETVVAKPLVVYSGRSEALVAPVLERFLQAKGIEVSVRYASTSELVAMILEEGDASPADLFLSQDAAALGALASAGRLKRLDDALLESVPSRFRAPGGDWLGISGRARSVVYAPERISAADLPRSLEEIRNPRYRGRFGVAPVNGSFQAHMAVYRAVHGADALGELLSAMAGNEPALYPKNSAIVEAVVSGEIDFGLVNHYYLLRAKAEDPTVTAENFFQPEGEASSFINLAGVGVLSDRVEARTLIEFLLSEEAQSYFAARTFEYPVVSGIDPAASLLPIDSVATTAVDYGAVSAALPETLAAIAESGLFE